MTILEKKVGYRFTNLNLLFRSLTHKSFHNENPGESLGNNERLEFLGDSVLGLVLSDQLMRALPDVNEGDLSKLRASLVNEAVLAEMAVELDMGNLIRLGKGEKQNGGAENPRLLASAFEAFLGALYIDGGYAVAQKAISEMFKSRLDTVDVTIQYKTDYKTRLQEKIQNRYKETPFYEVIGEVGPDHEKEFVMEVRITERTLGQGRGSSKKIAAQEAARLALEGF